MKTLSLVLPCLLLTACMATTTPRVDEQMGLSSAVIKALQVVNPDASKNADPVAGVDGKSARAAMENYRDSQRKPATTGVLPSAFGGN